MLRFAPSLVTHMNIGDLRIALLNYMVSIQKNKDLVIRIDDTNKNKEILELLNLFSITYKYVINQSENLKYHSQFAMQLLMDRKAFNCFCGEEILQEEKDEAKKSNIAYTYNGFCENLSDAATFECEAAFTVRIKKPNENIKFTDLVQGNFDFSPQDIDSFIILNHDKTSTYNFACAVDDLLSDISIVIRDEKYINDTPKQIHIRNTIGYDKQIQYVHLPSILNTEKIYVQDLINDGYLPASIANYLVLLCYDTSKEIFTIEEAIQWFDISKVIKNSVKFDINKLKSINKEHIQNMDELRLSKILGYSDKDIGVLAKIYLEECATIKQIKVKIDNIFKDKKTDENFKIEFNKIISCLKDAPFINDFEEFENYIIKKTNIEKKDLDTPLRLALTNEESGPNLNDIYPLIKNYLGEIIK